jgi:hypothetical protein
MILNGGGVNYSIFGQLALGKCDTERRNCESKAGD